MGPSIVLLQRRAPLCSSKAWSRRVRFEANWRDAIYYRFYEKAYGVGPMLGVRTDQYKLIHYEYDGHGSELFDLKKDPNELKNIFDDGSHREIRESLQQKLRELQTQYGDE